MIESNQIASGIGVGIGLHYADGLLGKFLGPNNQTDSTKVLQVFAKTRPLMTRLGVCVVFPVIEETLYRCWGRQAMIKAQECLIDPSAAEKTEAKVARGALNSIVFAAAHLNPKAALQANARTFCALFLSGVGYNALVETFDSILPSTIAHSVVNSLALRKLIKN